jgi:hypothetical protein
MGLENGNAQTGPLTLGFFNERPHENHLTACLTDNYELRRLSRHYRKYSD